MAPIPCDVKLRRAAVHVLLATYSLAACDLDRRQWGVAVQSKFPAIGALAPWAEPEVGAVVTQAFFNPHYGPEGLSLLREGASAAEVVERLVAADEDRAVRQLGIVDAEGRAASHTGAECPDWAGQRTGPCYAAQGNTLVSAETVDAIVETFLGTQERPLAERLLAALDAAQAAGGDRRGQQAAALVVVERGRGYGGSDRLVDLRVDDHPQPLRELRRLYALFRAAGRGG